MTIDLIIGGASKAGTTALDAMLRQCPDFCLAARKELHGFARPDIAAAVAGPGDAAVLAMIPRSLDDHLRHFRHKRPGQIAVEISPSYLFHHATTAPRIAAALPQVRMAFVLRHPVHKAYSQYLHLRGEGRETLSFADALAAEPARHVAGYGDIWRYRASGHYAAAVATYQRLLGADRVMLILHDDLVAAPDRVLAALCRFAGLDGAQRFQTDLRANVSGPPRAIWLARAMAPNAATNALRRILPARAGAALRGLLRRANTAAPPPLDPALAADLARGFASDIAQLEALLGRPTGWRT